MEHLLKWNKILFEIDFSNKIQQYLSISSNEQFGSEEIFFLSCSLLSSTGKLLNVPRSQRGELYFQSSNSFILIRTFLKNEVIVISGTFQVEPRSIIPMTETDRAQMTWERLNSTITQRYDSPFLRSDIIYRSMTISFQRDTLLAEK